MSARGVSQYRVVFWFWGWELGGGGWGVYRGVLLCRKVSLFQGMGWEYEFHPFRK